MLSVLFWWFDSLVDPCLCAPKKKIATELTKNKRVTQRGFF